MNPFTHHQIVPEQSELKAQEIESKTEQSVLVCDEVQIMFRNRTKNKQIKENNNTKQDGKMIPKKGTFHVSTVQ